MDPRLPPSAPLSLDELSAIALARGDAPLRALYVSTRGRVSRADFWLKGVLALLLAGLLGKALLVIAGVESDWAGHIVDLLLVWPGIAVSAKRWHDCDRRAWWVLVNLIPAIGWLVGLVANGVLPGTHGPNRYGPDPLGRPARPARAVRMDARGPAG